MSRRHPSGTMLVRMPLLLALVGGCGSTGPRPLVVGTDECAHCHMTLAGSRYAGEIVTRTGKTYTFDDPGCLADFYLGGSLDPARIQAAWVTNFLHPDEWMTVEEAAFVRVDTLRTPMASGLAAVRPGAQADSLLALLGGTLLTWNQVLEARRGRS